jgi:hypothetical protein
MGWRQQVLEFEWNPKGRPGARCPRYARPLRMSGDQLTPAFRWTHAGCPGLASETWESTNPTPATGKPEAESLSLNPAVNPLNPLFSLTHSFQTHDFSSRFACSFRRKRTIETIMPTASSNSLRLPTQTPRKEFTRSTRSEMCPVYFVGHPAGLCHVAEDVEGRASLRMTWGRLGSPGVCGSWRRADVTGPALRPKLDAWIDDMPLAEERRDGDRDWLRRSLNDRGSILQHSTQVRFGAPLRTHLADIDGYTSSRLESATRLYQ